MEKQEEDREPTLLVPNSDVDSAASVTVESTPIVSDSSIVTTPESILGDNHSTPDDSARVRTPLSHHVRTPSPLHTYQQVVNDINST